MTYATGSFYEEIQSVEGGFAIWSTTVDSRLASDEEAIAGKFNQPIGTTSQYIRGDGSLATFPTIPSLPIAISNVTGLLTALEEKAATSHTHVINDISNASPLGKTLMAVASVGAARSAILSMQTHIADSATNAPVDCPTNAPNDAPTNLNVITTLLGALVGQVNATNDRQNQIANNCNSIGTKVNAGFGILNTLAGKFNLSLDILETNNLMAA